MRKIDGPHVLAQKVIVVKVIEVDIASDDSGVGGDVGEIGDKDGWRKEGRKLGRYMVVGNKLIKRVGEKVDVIQTFETEEERVEAIRTYCMIDINPEDVLAAEDALCSLNP